MTNVHLRQYLKMLNEGELNVEMVNVTIDNKKIQVPKDIPYWKLPKLRIYQYQLYAS